jgi:glycosyltransferase involved in cell wall biosynthesis
VEGVREILGSLAPQQVIPAADPKRLSERVSAILGNPQLAERLGRDNRVRVEHEFSVRAMVDAHQQLYVALTRHTAR